MHVASSHDITLFRVLEELLWFRQGNAVVPLSGQGPAGPANQKGLMPPTGLNGVNAWVTNGSLHPCRAGLDTVKVWIMELDSCKSPRKTRSHSEPCAHIGRDGTTDAHTANRRQQVQHAAAELPSNAHEPRHVQNDFWKGSDSTRRLPAIRSIWQPA